jgi:hypothetical protein
MPESRGRCILGSAVPPLGGIEMRVSVRDLILLTLAAALAIGWSLQYRESVSAIDEATFQIERLTVENGILRSCHRQIVTMYERDTGKPLSFPLPEVLAEVQDNTRR